MDDNFIMMPVPSRMFTTVCALLGGAALAAVGSDERSGNGSTAPAAETATTTNVAMSDASPSEEVEVDSAGVPFDPEIHTGTKKKDGTWRAKKGMADAAAELAESGPVTGTSSETPTPSATSQTATEAASAPSDTSTDEDDEFAAFRAASEASAATDAAAAEGVPARTWTDADLGALCNQAAVKLGDPNPVKELIAQFVPKGEVAHSRNVPVDKREDFAKAVEEKAGIEFAG